MNKKSIINERFGRLIVLEETSEKFGKSRDIVYLCLCDCGNKKLVAARHLRDGGTRSCGCLGNETRIKSGNNQKKDDRKSVLINGLFAKFKNDAKKRRISVEIGVDFFENLVLSECFYCGESPKNEFMYTYSKEKIKYSGIDRVNSEKGYCEDNVVSCCWRCNSSKNNMSLSEFSIWLLRISNKYMKTETFVELTNEMKDNI